MTLSKLNKWAISEMLQASVLKRGQVQNLSCENDFFIIMQIKLIFTKKVLYLALF